MFLLREVGDEPGDVGSPCHAERQYRLGDRSFSRVVCRLRDHLISISAIASQLTASCVEEGLIIKSIANWLTTDAIIDHLPQLLPPTSL